MDGSPGDHGVFRWLTFSSSSMYMGAPSSNIPTFSPYIMLNRVFTSRATNSSLVMGRPCLWIVAMSSSETVVHRRRASKGIGTTQEKGFLMSNADSVRRTAFDEQWFKDMGFHKLDECELNQVGEWLSQVLEACGATECDIDEIRADGHLVVLSDGSMWEVSSIDAPTADLWSPVDDVIIYDGHMYHIDETECVEVEHGATPLTRYWPTVPCPGDAAAWIGMGGVRREASWLGVFSWVCGMQTGGPPSRCPLAVG
jgi:hypothetical protein